MIVNGVYYKASNNFLEIIIKERIPLMENISDGEIVHKIDMILNKNIPFEIDVYKTSIKFEVIQK